MRVSPFRSVVRLAGGRRTIAPTVDRATFVVCAIEDCRFALPVAMVERVLRYGSVQEGLGTPIAFAGQSVPVFDLREALGFGGAHVPTPASRQVILSASGFLRAVVVDTVHEVVTIDRTAIRARDASSVPLTMRPDAASSILQFALGIFTRPEREVVILDILPLITR